MKTTLSILALGQLAFAQEAPNDAADEEPPKDIPAWGIYDDKTAESYDHEKHSMVWFSISGYKEDQQEKYLADYKITMTALRDRIDKEFPDRKYYVVFFDATQYVDHAKEGLNCQQIESKSCVTVIQAAEGEELEEVVYTKTLAGPELHPDGHAQADAQREDFFQFVSMVEKATKKDASEDDKKAAETYKHVPTYDSLDESLEGGEGEDEDNEEDEPWKDHADEA